MLSPDERLNSPEGMGETASYEDLTASKCTCILVAQILDANCP